MAATRIFTDIAVAAPPQRIWHLLTNFSAYAAWNPYLVRVEGACAPGAALTVHAVMRPGEQPFVQMVELVAVTPMAMHWRGGLADRSRFVGDHHFLVAAGPNGGAHFQHFEDFGGTMADAILAEHGALIRANFMRFNAALKAAAES